MIKRAKISNFTIFSEADLSFGKNLNVFIGENGTGKTHLLKLLYSVLACGAEAGRKQNGSAPTKNAYQVMLADKLVGVFRPDVLGRLARRKPGRERCEVALHFENKAYDIQFGFATNSKSEVTLKTLPTSWLETFPAFFPVRELLSISPNFVSVYEGHYLEFEETWRDICLLLGAPLQRGPKESHIKQLLAPLEEAMEGSVDLDKNGRFYLKSASGKMEIPLVADGIRKLGMLSRLIATGALLEQGYLFWDEPEANLNAKMIRKIAVSICELSAQGIQVFLATHSLFLLRELELLLRSRTKDMLDVKFFGLHKADNGVGVAFGASLDDVGDIAALDEELLQSDRFMDMEGADAAD